MFGVLLAAGIAVAGSGASSVGGSFLLEIEGVEAGVPHAVHGGSIRADVAEDPVPGMAWPAKHIASIEPTPFELEVGLDMGPELWSWVQGTLQGAGTRRSGRVVARDADGSAPSVREFHDALITEVGFPAMDAASKDPAYASISFVPEQLRYVVGVGGGSLAASRGVATKRWLASNFRLDLGDLPCGRVTRIDAFTIEQRLVADEAGRRRLRPDGLAFPNLKLTIGAADAKPWYDWFEDFVVRGNSGPGEERSGRLTFLAPDQQTELGHVDFKQVGIFSINDAEAATAGDNVRRFEVELYVEHMQLTVR